MCSSDLPGVEGVSESQRAALASRYGFAAAQVLALAGQDPELAQPIVPDMPDLIAEAAFAAANEQALSVGDVLLRRTRLGLLAASELCRSDEVPRRVAAAMAPTLGWSAKQVDVAVEDFMEEARSEGICAQ